MDYPVFFYVRGAGTHDGVIGLGVVGLALRLLYRRSTIQQHHGVNLANFNSSTDEQSSRLITMTT